MLTATVSPTGLNDRVTRWVLHIDMDAFFAAVEQLTRPTLRGRAVLVGGPGPRGTVAGASYESRRYGARSAMPMAQARRLCPVATVLPPRFAVYSAASERVFALLRDFSPVLERISLDEAFTEPPDLQGATAAEVEAAVRALRDRIRGELGLVASVGAASGKTMAKIASDLAKPDGLLVVPPGGERATLRDLPVRALWGIGPVSEAKLHRIGVRTLGEFAALDLGDVTALLGQAIGTELHALAQGRDSRPVAERAETKQVSAETTFDENLTDPAQLADEARSMAEAAHTRLVKAHRAARTVTVKVRDADFTTISRSETINAATTDRGTLTAMALRLIRLAVPFGTQVRLVGVSLSGLSTGEQEPLFEPVSPTTRRTFGGSAVPAPSGVEWEPGPDDAEPPDVTVADVSARAEPVRPAGQADRHDSTETGATSEVVTQDSAASGDHHPGGRPVAVPPGAAVTRRAGDDVSHPEFGHGWVQGAGVGRVTVRFETQATGPGPARTFALTDPLITTADPLDSLGPAFRPGSASARPSPEEE
ncbi:DNA polymerase IV [Actinoalloteichus sp. GBA129-24]|nr:DNA polymerase IV [Actinoalloteichus sp. GBA129-24]